MKATITTAFLISTALFACQQKSEPPPPATTTGATATAVTATAATAATATAAPLAASAVPTPEDFEAAAAQKTTAATIDSQLDAIEKDIAASPK